MESLVGSEVWTRRNALDWNAEASLRFHWVQARQRAADRLAKLRGGSIGSLALGDPFGPTPGAFEDAKRDISRISLRELGLKQGRILNLPASGPCAEKKPIRLVVAYDRSAYQVG